MAKKSDSSPAPIKISKKVLKEAEDLVEKIMELCTIDADIEVEKGSYDNIDGDSEEYVDIRIEGEEIGVLIGYLGRNLKSLQKIVGLMLNKRLSAGDDETGFVRVVIDVSGYRGKREESIQRMAEQAREDVLASGESSDMPAMTSYERRVIHTYLGEYDDVTTESFGEGRDRYVKVLPIGGISEDTPEEGNRKDDDDDNKE